MSSSLAACIRERFHRIGIVLLFICWLVALVGGGNTLLAYFGIRHFASLADYTNEIVIGGLVLGVVCYLAARIIGWTIAGFVGDKDA